MTYTITDEQICELRASASGLTPVALDLATVELCDIALGWADLQPCLNTDPAHACVADQRDNARARCAEIFNARNMVRS